MDTDWQSETFLSTKVYSATTGLFLQNNPKNNEVRFWDQQDSNY